MSWCIRKDFDLATVDSDALCVIVNANVPHLARGRELPHLYWDACNVLDPVPENIPLVSQVWQWSDIPETVFEVFNSAFAGYRWKWMNGSLYFKDHIDWCPYRLDSEILGCVGYEVKTMPVSMGELDEQP